MHGPNRPPTSLTALSDDNTLLKIGEFAVRAGTNLRTLRYYEELGLLIPAERSAGRFRYYRPTDLNRVRMIHNLQGMGMPLEKIRELLDCRAQTDRDAWRLKVGEALEAQRSLIAERIQALEAQRDGVDGALEQLQGQCDTCNQRPHEDNNFCHPCDKTGHPLPDFLSALF